MAATVVHNVVHHMLLDVAKCLTLQILECNICTVFTALSQSRSNFAVFAYFVTRLDHERFETVCKRAIKFHVLPQSSKHFLC